MIPQFGFYLFDVDGTLLDSAGDITTAVLDVLTQRGRGHMVTRDYLRGHIGLHLRATFEAIFPEYGEEQMQELVLDYRRTYLERNHKSTSLYPGVAEGLAALGGLKATATTKGSETTGKVLEMFGLRPYFDHVQGTDGFPHKPAPDVLLRAMEALGAGPEDTLMVGDTPVDMAAARAAGVKFCAVRYGYGSGKLAEDDPDYWVDSLRELAAASATESLAAAEAIAPSDRR